MSVKRTQAERTDATRRALIAAARELFGSRGYAATSTPQIVATAGVTRGALYHHFGDKAGLFRAVYEAVEADVIARVGEAAYARDDPLERLRAGAEAFLDACLEPEVQRITLIDAPAVLGWEAWRELDAAYGLGVIRTGLSRAMDAGAIATQPVDPLAHAVLGALTETALMVARADNPQQQREHASTTITTLLQGLSIQH